MSKEFEIIFKNNYRKVFAFIYNITNNKELAEDITQETFVKVYKNLETLPEIKAINLWLNKIAYNTMIDFTKKKANQETLVEEDILKKIVDLKVNHVKDIEQKVMSECVNDKINLVPENYRGPLFLDMHGFSNKEIAEILGCTLDNAKIRLHRGKKKLKEVLGNQCSFYLDERSVLC